ncbi:MAG: hypothetical protein AAB553_00580 [Patescibacteria group bacterium]
MGEFDRSSIGRFSEPGIVVGQAVLTEPSLPTRVESHDSEGLSLLQLELMFNLGVGRRIKDSIMEDPAKGFSWAQIGGEPIRDPLGELSPFGDSLKHTVHDSGTTFVGNVDLVTCTDQQGLSESTIKGLYEGLNAGGMVATLASGESAAALQHRLRSMFPRAGVSVVLPQAASERFPVKLSKPGKIATNLR